jgi:2-(1,2-epoxy-1,2-dihydrophenyl)acetyl-CoA isomerase
MSFEDLRYDKRDGVARIAFNRPARRNALGDTSTRQLVQACEDAAADAQVRVVVITGEGEAFCAGGDFRDTFERGAQRDAAAWSERIRRGPNELVRVLQGMPQPVVASINGAAVGGGATIALACDLRIASERARFAFPFARIGITPEFGCSHLLPRVVGLGRAMELLLLAETIDAATAARIGLVNRVVPHAELESATAAIVARLLEMPAGALGAIKSLLHRGLSLDRDAQLELEAEALGRAFTSDEHRRAVTAFLQRRHAPPPGATPAA